MKPDTFIDTFTLVSNSEISKNIFFTEHLWTTASVFYGV